MYGPGCTAWRRMRCRFSTSRRACSSPRSWAFVRQNARTPPRSALRARRGAGGSRRPSSARSNRGADVAEPDLVLQPLADLLAVDRRPSCGPPGPTSRSASGPSAAEASIDEELGRLRHRRTIRRAPTSRLRSGTCRDADDVLDLVERHGEVVGDVADRVAGQEAIDEVLDACAAAVTNGRPNATSGSTTTSALPVDREPYLGRPAVVAVGDALQVVADELGELVLAGRGTTSSSMSSSLALLGVVEEHLGAIGVQALGRERVLDADLTREHLDRRTDPLQRTAGSAGTRRARSPRRIR